MEKEDKRGIFFGVIGVLTLIVAIIGASFAYFSINAKSDKDAVKVKAASVQIVYDDGEKIAIENLIPSTEAVVQETVRRAAAGESDSEGNNYVSCRDDKGYTVCGFYDFTLTNNGDGAVKVKAYVEPTALTDGEKAFTNLNFVLYDVTNGGNGTSVGKGTFSYEGNFGIVGNPATLDSTLDLAGNGTTQKYRLFVWLNEAGAANDAEQGAVFNGTVKIDVVGAENGQITGTATGA